jgi:protein-disulfide isomerase
VRGNPAAKVTVINYDDLECPYCAQMHQSLFPATLNRYKDTVRFIYKGNPLVSIHPWAMHAAVDSNCLAEQGGEAYWAYVDYIHSHANEVNGEDRDLTKSFERLDLIARQHATLNKLDEARLNACMAKQDESAVRATMKEAETLRVEGAPALFVNGVRVEGAIPQAEIWKVLDKVLRAEGVTPPAAVPAPAAPASAMPSQAKPEPPGN